MKKLFILLFATIVFTIGVAANDTLYNLDGGTLTIWGIGAMDDATDSVSPWKDSADSIHTVIVENGITKIGNFAFYEN